MDVHKWGGGGRLWPSGPSGWGAMRAAAPGPPILTQIPIASLPVAHLSPECSPQLDTATVRGLRGGRSGSSGKPQPAAQLTAKRSETQWRQHACCRTGQGGPSPRAGVGGSAGDTPAPSPNRGPGPAAGPSGLHPGSAGRAAPAAATRVAPRRHRSGVDDSFGSGCSWQRAAAPVAAPGACGSRGGD